MEYVSERHLILGNASSSQTVEYHGTRDKNPQQVDTELRDYTFNIDEVAETSLVTNTKVVDGLEDEQRLLDKMTKVEQETGIVDPVSKFIKEIKQVLSVRITDFHDTKDVKNAEEIVGKWPQSEYFMTTKVRVRKEPLPKRTMVAFEPISDFSKTEVANSLQTLYSGTAEKKISTLFKLYVLACFQDVSVRARVLQAEVDSKQEKLDTFHSTVTIRQFIERFCLDQYQAEGKGSTLVFGPTPTPEVTMRLLRYHVEVLYPIASQIATRLEKLVEILKDQCLLVEEDTNANKSLFAADALLNFARTEAMEFAQTIQVNPKTGGIFNHSRDLCACVIACLRLSSYLLLLSTSGALDNLTFLKPQCDALRKVFDNDNLTQTQWMYSIFCPSLALQDNFTKLLEEIRQQIATPNISNLSFTMTNQQASMYNLLEDDKSEAKTTTDSLKQEARNILARSNYVMAQQGFLKETSMFKRAIHTFDTHWMYCRGDVNLPYLKARGENASVQLHARAFNSYSMFYLSNSHYWAGYMFQCTLGTLLEKLCEPPTSSSKTQTILRKYGSKNDELQRDFFMDAETKAGSLLALLADTKSHSEFAKKYPQLLPILEYVLFLQAYGQDLENVDLDSLPLYFYLPMTIKFHDDAKPFEFDDTMEKSKLDSFNAYTYLLGKIQTLGGWRQLFNPASILKPALIYIPQMYDSEWKTLHSNNTNSGVLKRLKNNGNTIHFVPALLKPQNVTKHSSDLIVGNFTLGDKTRLDGDVVYPNTLSIVSMLYNANAIKPASQASSRDVMQYFSYPDKNDPNEFYF